MGLRPAAQLASGLDGHVSVERIFAGELLLAVGAPVRLIGYVDEAVSVWGQAGVEFRSPSGGGWMKVMQMAEDGERKRKEKKSYEYSNDRLSGVVQGKER